MKYFKSVFIILIMGMSCKPPINPSDPRREGAFNNGEQTIAPVIPVLQSLEANSNNLPINPTESSPTVRLFNIKPGDRVQLFSDTACTNPLSEQKIASTHQQDISTHPLNMGDYQIYAKSWDSSGTPSPCSPHHIDFSYYVASPTMVLQKSQMSEQSSDENTHTISLSNLYSEGSAQLFSDSDCTESLSDKETVPEATNELEISIALMEEVQQIYVQSWDAGDNPSPCSPHPIAHASTSSVPEPLPILMGQTSSYTSNTPTIYLAYLPLNGEYQLFSDSACTQSISSRSSVTNLTMRVTTNPLPIGNHNIYTKVWDSDGNPSSCSSDAATFSYKVIPPTTVLKRGESSPGNPTPTISLYNLPLGGKVQIFSDSACSHPLSERQNVVESITMDITTHSFEVGTHRIYAKSWDVQDNPSECSPHFTRFTYRPLATPPSQSAPITPHIPLPSSPYRSTMTPSPISIPSPQQIPINPGSPPVSTPSPSRSIASQTFGSIQAPVYKKTSRGGGSIYGGKRIIDMKTKPGITVGNTFIDGSKVGYKYVSGAGVVDYADLPNGDKLIWKYSVQHKRGTKKTDGICSLASNYGGIHVEEKKIQQGDACIVTATASAPGFTSKSVSTSLYWYGKNDIRTVYTLPAPSESQTTTFGSIQAPVYKKTSRGGGSIYGGKRIIDMKTKPGITVGNTFIDGSKVGYKYVSGAGVVDYADLPNGDKLIWKYSVQHKRGTKKTDGICSLASNYGGIHVEEKKIQQGDACIVTATASAPGFTSKSVSTSLYWYGKNDIRTVYTLPAPSESQTTTFGSIQAPVYKKTSRGGGSIYGGKRIIDMKTKPGITVGNTFIDGSKVGYKYVSGAGVVDYADLPNGDKLIWKYSVQHKRGTKKTDGICSLASNYGGIHVEEKKIQQGDACIVTATASAPGFTSKSVSTSLYWYGKNDIRTVYKTSTPSPTPSPSPSPTPSPSPPPPTPPPGQTPTKKFNILSISPPVFELNSNARAVGGKITVPMKSTPTYDGRSSHLSTGEKLTWFYSVQGLRSGRHNNNICSISSAGVLKVVEKNIKKGDNCKITYTVNAPGYHSTSMTMNHFWQYVPVSQCQGAYIARKNCKFNERIPYNWGNSFTHKCIKRDVVNIGMNTTGSLRCTGCVVSKEYPCN